MGLNNFTTATGAAEFTDVDLDSVSLPSGYEISEDGGDLVVRDTSGTIVLRRVDGGNWSFETNTVEAGQLGTASSPVDVEANDVNAQGTLTKNGQAVGLRNDVATIAQNYQSGPAHGEGGGAFRGATVAPSGQVILAPLNSANVGIVDTSGGTVDYQSGPAHGEGSAAFLGATVAPSGQVILAPFNSSNVGIVDTSGGTVTYQSGPAHGEGGNAFAGATVAPSGQVILAPNDSANVGVTSGPPELSLSKGLGF
jgi:uncharacterized spore protein YtfJ